jgi:hypothetical protein
MRKNKQRDSSIYAQHKQGATYAALSTKYDLSPSRISEICNDQRRQEYKTLAAENHCPICGAFIRWCVWFECDNCGWTANTLEQLNRALSGDPRGEPLKLRQQNKLLREMLYKMTTADDWKAHGYSIRLYQEINSEFEQGDN